MDPFIKIHFLQFPKNKYIYEDQSSRSQDMDREDLRHFQTTPNAKKFHLCLLIPCGSSDLASATNMNEEQISMDSQFDKYLCGNFLCLLGAGFFPLFPDVG